jgi:hypothetical protein
MRDALWLAAGSCVLAAVAAIGACSAGGSDGRDSVFTTGGPPGSGGAGASGGDSASGIGGDESTSSFNPTTTNSTGTGSSSCNHAPDEDGDGDGWTGAQGDCNDCDANVNPGAIEVVATVPDADGGLPEPSDENCNMEIDEELAPCDAALAMDDTNPMSGAQAIGLCTLASTDGTPGNPGYSWGVMSAQYVLPNGSAAPVTGTAVGILPDFGGGVNPQQGTKMLALSSGSARAANHPGACAYSSCTHGVGTSHQAPPNFPAPVPNCPGGAGTPVRDDIALQVQLRAPMNATGYTFNFKFYSFEFPEYICSSFNDQFIALVNPPPMGAQNGNISFDSGNNPVSVNIAFFDVCDTATANQWAIYCTGTVCPPLPNPYCPSGTAQLVGTTFDGVPSGNAGGGTSWLVTQAPIGAGEEFAIRFAIWDATDTALDSTVLIDNFQWIAGAGTNVEVGTVVVPDPK